MAKFAAKGHLGFDSFDYLYLGQRVLAITSKIKTDLFSLEKLVFLAVLSFPLIILLLLAFEAYIALGIFLGALFIILIVQNYRYGLYFIVIGLPLFQSLTLKSDAATSVGLNIQYVIIPIVLVSWLSERISDKNLAAIRLPFLSLFSLFVLVLFLSLVNQLDINAPHLLRQGFLNIIALVNYLVLFYIIVNEDWDHQDLQKILWGFLIVAFLTAVIGIVQYFAAETNLVTGGLRATSTFKSYLRTNTKNNPNAFGTFMAFMAVAALWLWNIADRKHRKFILMLTSAIIFSLLLSFSRSSLLALIFAFLAYTFVRNKKAFVITMVISVLGLIALYFEPTTHRRIQSIFAVISDRRVVNMFLHINPWSLDWSYVEYYGIQGYNSDIISAAFRIWAWIQGVQLTIAHPVLGVGYHMNRAYSPWPTAENLYLDISCMTGLAGLSLFLIMQYHFLKDGFRLLRNPMLTHIGMFWLNILAVVFIVSLTGSILFHGKLLGIFWILAGVFYNVKQREDNYLHQS